MIKRQKIKLIINYPKLANFYIFLSDLSQWNQFTNFPSRKRIWLKQIPPLSLEERNALRQFGDILQNSRGNPEVVLIFGPPKKTWQMIRKMMTKNQTEKLKSVFRVFRPKFNAIWQKRRIDFLKLKRAILRKKSKIEQAAQIIDYLCNISPKKSLSSITIKLLFSQGKNDIQAWAYRNAIAIEGSSFPLKNIDDLINGILLHEYFHLALNRNTDIKNKIVSLAKIHRQSLLKLKIPEWPTHVILEEALVSSFIPEGYLSKELSQKNIKKDALQQINRKNIERLLKMRYFCALKMYNLAKEYTDSQKSIDSKYLTTLVNVLKQFNKIY